MTSTPRPLSPLLEGMDVPVSPIKQGKKREVMEVDTLPEPIETENDKWVRLAWLFEAGSAYKGGHNTDSMACSSLITLW